MRGGEWEALKRVEWYFFGPIGDIPPAEETFHANLTSRNMVAWSLSKDPPFVRAQFTKPDARILGQAVLIITTSGDRLTNRKTG